MTLLPSLFQRGAWLPLRAAASLFGSLRIAGTEHTRGLRGPVVLASNHVSELDPLLLAACLPFASALLPLIYVSRGKAFYAHNWRGALYGGRFFRMMGAYEAYTGLKDYRQALRNHFYFLAKGRSICIFPMGDVAKRTKGARARGGGMYLAYESGTPVLPARIDGLEGFSAKGFFGRKHRITVTFGAPFPAAELFDGAPAPVDETRNDYETAATRLMERINALP